MLSPERELELHRFLSRLYAKRRDARDAQQTARSALRSTAVFLEADRACLARVPAGEETARIDFTVGDPEGWDPALLAGFYLGQRPPIPPDTLLAPLRRRGRMWRVLALARGEGRTFDAQDRNLLAPIASAVSELLGGIDRERATEVRSRIERKIMEELRPKDLFYQILHGLRTLTGYDHSSALLIAGDQGDALTLAAEQIAWRKGKSGRIGLRQGLDADLQRLMAQGGVHGLDRRGEGWVTWSGNGAEPLAELLDYNTEAGDLREGTMICAPIRSREGVVGALKIAARHRGSLGPYEAKLVDRFMPQVSVAIQNSRRAESLQAGLLEAERRSAMADLARGVAHDMNNALGAILPLVQQLRQDSQEGELDTDVLAEDLQQIEGSMQVCRRIFGGMLSFARGAARGGTNGSLPRAVESALTILRDGFERRRITLRLEIAADLPPVRGSQSDLDQLFFNLMANARDAMPEGGTLRVGARVDDGRLTAWVADTGTGIAEDDLPRIQEPFFTTKPKGSGLGLSICRSILWGMGGRLSVDSREGEGTRVEIVLPVDGARQAEGD